MRVWYIRSREGLFATAAFLFIGGAGTFWFGALTVLLGLSSEADAVANGVRVAVTSAISLIWLAGAIGYLRAVRKITVKEDGAVTLVRAIGSTQLTTRDIRELEGKYRSDYEGNRFWTLRIRYGRRGSVEFNEFYAGTELRDMVRALNPDVSITGLWPGSTPS